MERRYYVHHVNERQWQVREHATLNAEPTEEDRIVRDDFAGLGHAHYFADTMNQLQRRLDAQYGHWVQKAV